MMPEDKKRTSFSGAAREPVEVEAYSGYREGETPRAVVREGRRHRVIEIQERKRFRDFQSGRTMDVFICRLDDGRDIVLEHPEPGRWFIGIGPK